MHIDQRRIARVRSPIHSAVHSGRLYPCLTVICTRWQASVEMLSRMRVVVLMQEEGPCWIKCCPHWDNTTYSGVCQPPTVQPPYNASTFPGCDPSCDQHRTQNEVFARVQAAARASGRPPVHAMLCECRLRIQCFECGHVKGRV